MHSTQEATNPGKKIFKLLKKYPNIIPRQALPSSVFFLLNFNNFYEAGKTWLGQALVDCSENVRLYLDFQALLFKG